MSPEKDLKPIFSSSGGPGGNRWEFDEAKKLKGAGEGRKLSIVPRIQRGQRQSVMGKNKLYYGDNLIICKQYIEDESVDLIYLDPPFKSNQDYNILFKEQDGDQSASQILAFEDTWHWDQISSKTFDDIIENGGRLAECMEAFKTIIGGNDMLAYLTMMAPRLSELSRVLKPRGSIYLHCDSTASAYLRILMDSIFGPKQFRNEIIWKRSHGHNSASRYGANHDVILYYGKTEKTIWNNVYHFYDSEYAEKHYRHIDKNGRRYKHENPTGAGIRHGATGKPWHNIDPTAKGRHWAKTPEEMEKLDARGLIHWPDKPGAWPYIMIYLDEKEGVPCQDTWTDIDPINMMAMERLGYPTQKPEALLERILAASSAEGDIILDPFCGCGTAVAVAQKMNRQWIGIDITHLAITLIKHRLKDTFGYDLEIEVIGEPVSLPDAKALAEEDRYQFQWWTLGLVGARPVEQKKGADKGIDGRIYFHDKSFGEKAKQIIFSVKSGNVNVRDVRDLRGVIEREKAEIGVLISLEEPTSPMIREAADGGIYESSWGKHSKLQIVTIKELLEGKKIDAPALKQTSSTFRRAPKQKVIRPKAEKLPFDK